MASTESIDAREVERHKTTSASEAYVTSYRLLLREPTVLLAVAVAARSMPSLRGSLHPIR